MIGYAPGIGDGLLNALGDGNALGPRTLPFFYAMHTTVIPVLMAGLMGFHFWRIRKAGGLVVPRRPSEPVDKTPNRVPAFPEPAVKGSLHGPHGDGHRIGGLYFF